MEFFLIALLTIIIELILGKKYLVWIEKKNYVQPLLNVGPDHKQKQGTPTMGGISFIATIIFMLCLSMFYLHINNLNYDFLPIMIVVILSYAYIGYRDDILKVTKNDNEQGLTPKQKLFAQFLVAIATVIYLNIINFNMILNINLLNTNIDMNSNLSFIMYIFVIIFLFLAVTNATNLTDGLDGLLSSTYIFSFIPLLVIAVNQNQTQIVFLTVIVISSLIGFLKYNYNPAQMFMGDTGSIALGGLLVLTSIFLHVELMIFYFGFIFLVETISVIMQVTYFKFTKKKYGEGRRFFKMAPFHHHLEKEGLNEKKIVLIFSCVQIFASIIGLLVYFY